jgi:hypothetical protein
MCVPYRQLSSKIRRLIALGNLCLVVGLLLWSFVHPAGQIERNWVHTASGFLIGLSIAINLFALIGARRCRAIAPEEL